MFDCTKTARCAFEPLSFVSRSKNPGPLPAAVAADVHFTRRPSASSGQRNAVFVFFVRDELGFRV